jgi:hypothetical protein
MSEKRKSDRQRTNSYFAICNADDGQPLGSLGNITTDGMMVIGRQPFIAGQAIKLRIEWPDAIDGHRQLTLDSECRWCQHSLEHELYFIGFKFQEVSSEIMEIILALIDSPYFLKGTNPTLDKIH